MTGTSSPLETGDWPDDRKGRAVSPSSQGSASRLLDQAGIEPLRAAFVARALNALAHMTTHLPTASLAMIVSASSDYDVLLQGIQAALTVRPDNDYLEEERLVQQARARGVASRRRIIQAEGGVLSSSQVGEHLGISRQAVDDRRKKGRLLGLRTGARSYAYPAWQLDQEGTLPGLETVLTALNRWDPWTQAAFLINASDRLRGRSPLEEMRGGRIDAVVQVANAYGEHGA